MSENKKKQTLLRMLPGIDTIMDKVNADPFFKSIPKTVLVQSSRWVVETLRSIILEGDQSVDKADFSDASILSSVKNKAGEIMSPNLTRTINATGVVVHTNLGRSLLASDAVENIVSIAGKYSNLEFNLES
ncbi:MAG: L-seryl-tRNA(Sec) selenium transferase, partial [Deltaproteobacteria bacterium]|nr:L-seryl-tRNA(Sec) selenium transferase [Deltaproteobacteria bacterium]